MRDDVEILHVWTFSKFLARLENMRDAYHSHENDDCLNVDAWCEISPVEAEMRGIKEVQRASGDFERKIFMLEEELRRKEAQVVEKDEEIRRLRGKQQQDDDVFSMTSKTTRLDRERLSIKRDKTDSKAKEATEQLQKCMDLCASNQNLLTKFLKHQKRKTELDM